MVCPIDDAVIFPLTVSLKTGKTHSPCRIASLSASTTLFAQADEWKTGKIRLQAQGALSVQGRYHEQE
jgi:hypothetical protein